MSLDAVEKIANAVLYEGYMLYPYRPSAVKNRQRFNFGVLYPQGGPDASHMQTECLVTGTVAATLDVRLRFLHLAERDNWQEGHVRSVSVSDCSIASILEAPLPTAFVFSSEHDGQETVAGELELAAARVDDGLFRIAIRISNCASLRDGADRDQALLRSLVSVHIIIRVSGGEFVSLLDPPEHLRAAAAECRNAGWWPVLAGEEKSRDTMLSAPIILYDYPQIAPESAGDLFDATEIDEILALRILTMTDAEKDEVRNSDDRARLILERTENLPPEHFQKLHGAMRGLRR